MDPVVSPEEATGVTDATQGGIRVAFDRKNYDKTRYKTIYAQYIDADLTPSEGRRIGKAHRG
ncbi:signal recognition particle subunit SRP19 [Angomonas deanei]|uniref:Uncharacterized protein n=1 Tax=Angomonas deanei TaxID=59799 RepID=A0A7G2CCT2_9TRYP|nr:signal recognition particle subunit SRP19 [Angomonas deanei]CAD2217638.1 hypothetical protein, conserved [Angomonas deanei]|eukprot:EPY25942.1 signal recognition particle subunit SRP19 [Angomonas deanei]